MFRENVLGFRPKSDCAVEMTMYVHWNFSIEKICIKNMVYTTVLYK